MRSRAALSQKKLCAHALLSVVGISCSSTARPLVDLLTCSRCEKQYMCPVALLLLLLPSGVSSAGRQLLFQRLPRKNVNGASTPSSSCQAGGQGPRGAAWRLRPPAAAARPVPWRLQIRSLHIELCNCGKLCRSFEAVHCSSDAKAQRHHGLCRTGADIRMFSWLSLSNASITVPCMRLFASRARRRWRRRGMWRPDFAAWRRRRRTLTTHLRRRSRRRRRRRNCTVCGPPRCAASRMDPRRHGRLLRRRRQRRTDLVLQCVQLVHQMFREHGEARDGVEQACGKVPLRQTLQRMSERRYLDRRKPVFMASVV